MLSRIKQFTISTLIALFALLMGGVWLLIAANAAQWSTSFWFGFGGFFGILLFLTASWWASHPATRQWPGFSIAAFTGIVMLIAGAIIKPFDGFEAIGFFLGLLDVVVIIVLATMIYIYGRKAPSA